MSTEGDLGSIWTNTARFLVNYVVRFLFAGLVLYCCWVPLQNIDIWFSWHVILCTFGYIPLMAESIMLFVGDELWSRQVSRKTKYIVHGVLVSISLVFIIAGNSFVFHNISSGYHFTSTHGITGLISMIILIISVFLGLIVNYADAVKTILPVKPVWFKFSHNIIGLLGYVIGIVSLCYGYYTNYFVFYTSVESRLAALFVTIVGTIWTMNGAFVSAYNQIKSILT
ncbi:hypothetical protein NQ318_001320 [Aromia moschata]|uniref:ascorbate ferrireductase (transmembrane) n=1 Tax=Aromia moschata TaxID=1265417 RepID=A0AAV8ZHY3_9CUCU|nr:hypothetical protein NQ318_001320 [Aromia moschata]